MKIDSFTGKYHWLSNFCECTIFYECRFYQSSEAAYQAAKCKNELDKDKFVYLNAPRSKKMGRIVELRDDWNKVKLKVMEDILRCKFEQHPSLLKKLIETDDSELIEGNTWGDVYWGVCNGKGFNYLGRLLMKLRKEYADKNFT